MAAASSDFTDLAETGKTIADQWPQLVRSVQGLLAVWLAKVGDGTEPNDTLKGLDFELSGTKWRVVISGNDLLVQEDVASSWTTRNTFSATTGLTLAASAIVSGTFADARISESSVTQHQAALALATSQITSGTFADARIAQSNVTQHEGALTIAASQVGSGTFADARIAQSNVTQHQAAIDHGSLAGTGDDDHTQYSLADGSRAFTGEVGGVDPTADASLATKRYVDPSRTEAFKSADQQISNTLEDITDLTAVSIPGADGSKKYRITVNVEFSNTSGTNSLLTCQIHLGSNGDKGDTKLFSFSQFVNSVIGGSVGYPSPVFTPAAGDKIGLAVILSDSDTMDIKGSVTSSDLRSFFIVEEVVGA